MSGENVTLLALLAMPVLAAFGVPLRERLIWTIALIAVYVPLAGSGPSIQRAGVMGAAGLLATLAGRRASRLYALGLALVVTMAIDPGVAGNVGWQLSFAAVLGILLLASPIREWLLARMDRADRRRAPPSRGGGGRWRRALAEGIAVTVSATLATAPLIAYVFEEISLTSLARQRPRPTGGRARDVAGHGLAALAQIPGIPLAPLNGLDALLLAYVAQVAAWCGRPSWAVLHVHIGLLMMLATYAAMAATLVAGAWLARARLCPRRVSFHPVGWKRSKVGSWVGGLGGQSALSESRACALLGALSLFWPHRSDGPPAPPPGLRIEVLDVGQGDAILLQPRSAPAVLVDGGPPGDELAAKLHDHGVERLGAAVVTHDQSDHAAGIAEALGRLPISRLVYGRLDRRFLATAWADGARPDAGRRRHRASLRLAAPRSALAAARAPRRRPSRHRSERARPRDPRPLARLHDAADRRRRGRIDAARPGTDRRPQGRPPRQRRRRPRAAARPHPPAPRGDLGRRRQLLRPPDSRHARDPRRTPCPHPADRPRRHDRDRRSPSDPSP